LALKHFLKRIPLIGLILRYVAGNFVQRSTGKKNATFFSYRRNLEESNDYEITKINKGNSLYKDRFCEVKDFFESSLLQMTVHFLVNGTPNTSYYRFRLHRMFERTGLNEEKLKIAYERAAFMYTNRLMLRYHNYRVGVLILEIGDRLSLDKGKIEVLDYGCGVADPSLYLALSGVTVTIVDLDDRKFDFAIRRFQKRNLRVNSIRATQTEEPIDLGGKKFDVIIMAEFLEHVRNPRLFLEFAVEHLHDQHGILYDSLGSSHNHGIAGDHLKEAKEVIAHSDYSIAFKKMLCPLNTVFDRGEFEHFYMKRAVDSRRSSSS
jgi:2-polyprenyl-3-methyl-5-hydroxy-6-metoxy-1,4-benzoquinol methylase